MENKTADSPQQHKLQVHVQQFGCENLYQQKSGVFVKWYTRICYSHFDTNSYM